MAPDSPNDPNSAAENTELRARLDEAEEALRAIRCGEVDALVVQSAGGPQLFTLQGIEAESNRLRGGILAQVSEAIIAVDDEQRVIYLNTAAEAQYGVAASHVLGERLAWIYETRWARPEDEAAAMKAVRDCGHWRGENIHVSHSGRILHVESSFSLLHNEEGAAPGLLVVTRDITERRHAEQKLRDSEERLRLATDVAGLGIWTWEPAGDRVTWENDLPYEILGIPRDEPPITATRFAAEFVHLDDRAAFAQTFGDIRQDTGPIAMECRFLRRDGEVRWIEFTGKPVGKSAGAHLRILGTVRDITAQKNAETSLLRAKNAAEAANQSKDRFLAVLSHELRTPLTPVLMTVSALEHDMDLRADIRADIAMIKRNVQLETKLIDDLLDVSRIANGKVELKPEAVDLNEAVRHVCSICLPQLLEQNVKLEMELAEDAGTISADPARLQQVLWNVLKNAAKFTPAQGTVRVTTARLHADRCAVRVQDSGIGIPPEALAHIFNAFEQGDARITKQFGGLGLGLAISRALVELQGGTIRAESEGNGKGAAFIIELSGLAPQPAPAMPAATTSGANGRAPLRLLVVEDHADTARTLARLLGRAGFAVVSAANVASAIATAEREPFDLVLSDLGLPDGDGYEIIRTIRAKRAIPGIAMSGYGMDEDIRRSRDAGFTEHIVKPIVIPDLLAAIQRVTATREPA